MRLRVGRRMVGLGRKCYGRAQPVETQGASPIDARLWVRALSAVLLLLLSLLLCGCGGGSPVSKKNGKGAAVFTIKWPSARKSTRLIPAASNVIRIQIRGTDANATLYGTRDTVRPVTGPLTTMLPFNNLPPGQFTATASAYPDYTPPQNTPNESLPVQTPAQATATVPLTIADGQTTQSSLTMGTTITQVLPSALAGSSQTTGRFTPFFFSGQVRDKDGNNVLITPDSLRITVSDIAIAVFGTSGSSFDVRNAGKLGTVTVTITEPESGVAQSFSLTFLPAIYIADAFNHRVVRMDDMSGTNFTAFGTQGSGPGQFQFPRQIAVDSQNRIYVADNVNARIARLDDIGGTNFTTFGTQGGGIGQLNQPSGVGVDALNEIYIADAANNRVVRIDDIAGNNFLAFGSSGSGSGQFNVPNSIALDSRSRLYIADANNNRIVRVDNITGANFASYGVTGSGVGQFNAPFAIAIDSQDRIYIADENNNRIVRIDDMNGTNSIVYGSFGNGIGQFNSPESITVDAQNRIYIADFSNSRIVRIDDMAGTNFVAFGSFGSGLGQLEGPDGVAVR